MRNDHQTVIPAHVEVLPDEDAEQPVASAQIISCRLVRLPEPQGAIRRTAQVGNVFVKGLRPVGGGQVNVAPGNGEGVQPVIGQEVFQYGRPLVRNFVLNGRQRGRRSTVVQLVEGRKTVFQDGEQGIK